MIKLSTLIKRDKTVIRVKNDEQELALRMALHARGLKWIAGQSFATHAMKDDANYETNAPHDCISPSSGRYGPHKWCIANGYKVYQFSQVILDK